MFVVQNNETIEGYTNLISQDGTATFEVMFLDKGPATVDIRIFKVGENSNVNEKISFAVAVVPEFPAMLAILMTTSFAIVIVIVKLQNSNKYI